MCIIVRSKEAYHDSVIGSLPAPIVESIIFARDFTTYTYAKFERGAGSSTLGSTESTDGEENRSAAAHVTREAE